MYHTYLPLHLLLACTVWNDGFHVTRMRTEYILVDDQGVHYALIIDKGGAVTHVRSLHDEPLPEDLVAALKRIERA